MPIALSKQLRFVVANIPLRWVLILPFVVPTVGAVGMVGYLSYRNGQQAVQDLGHQLAIATNDRVIQELKVQLEKPILVNQLNGDAVDQGQLNLQNTSALESTLFTRLQQFNQISAALFVNPEGMLRLVERYPTTLYLGVANPSRPDQISIYQLDNQGRRGKLVHVDKLDVRRDRSFYARAVTTGKPGWSSVSQYGNATELTLNAFQPVYDRTTRQLIGVFAVHFRLNQLNQFLHGLDFSHSGQIIITEQNGDIIATSTSDRAAYPKSADANPNQQLKRQNIYESQDDLLRSLGEYLRDRSDALQTLDQPTSLEFRYNGELQYVEITPYQDQYGLNWRIVTVMPKSHFMKAIQANTQTTVLLCLLTLGVAVMLGLLADELLIARLMQFNRASRELATGNLNQRLPTDQPIYELNDLAQTFNQTAEQLQQYFNRIQNALEESEEKFTTIFRTSPDPIAIASLAEGRILEANDSLVQFIGYSRVEMIGRTALELNFWSNLEQRDQYRALLQQQGSVRNLEVQLQTKSGEVKTVLLSAEVRNLEGQDRLIVMSRDITDRKATELALQQSEARYRAIVEDQTELISRFLPDTTLLFVNDAFCRYFGINREEVIGKSYTPIVYEADRDRITQLLQSMNTDNPTLTIENRVVVNGEIRWTQWVNRLLFDAEDNIIELQSVGRDITTLKQTEEALRKSEANLLYAQRIAHVGSWEIDLGTQENIWSEELFFILGLDPSLPEPSYLEFTKRVPTEDRGAVIAAIQALVTKATSYEIEHRICRPDGTLRYVISKGQAMMNDQQQIVKLYGTVLDITDRKQAEIALQESEARLQEITHTINQVVYVISVTTGQYLYISPAYEKLWGYSCESLYQDPKSWLDRIHPEDLADVLQGLDQLFSGKQKRLQYRIICANGEVSWIESDSLVVYDEDNNPLRIVGLADDITDRKRLEQSLRWQAEEERLLATITQNIRQSLDLDQILATTVAEVQQTLKADRALIFRLNPDGSGQVIQEAVVPEYPEIEQMRWEDEHFPTESYAYYQQGIPRIVPDVTTDEWAACLVEFMQSVGVKSKIVAPIVQVRGNTSTAVWGLLIVHACSHFRAWHNSEADFLQRICNQLAIAIDQANLYQQLQIELAERKQTEKALKEREAMLRAIGDNLPKGFIYQRIYEPGRGSYYSYVSAGVERLLGLKPEAILANAKVIRMIGFEEDLAYADQVAQESLKNLTPIELQMRHHRPDGGIGWSSIRSTPRRLEDGRTVWDGVEVDITDLKRAETALRVSEEQFRRAFDEAPIGVSLVSITGQFVKVNARYCDLLGYTEVELLTLTFQEITHPDDLDADLEGVRQMLRGEIDSFQLEKRYITKDGTSIPVLMNAAMIRDHNGQPLYSVGHVQDIRDRLKVQRMKDEFISVISHELRTPLTSIQGALDLLGSGVYTNRPEKANHMLKIAINNSARLVRLVNDILTLERLESGKVQLVMEQCQVSDLMEQTVEGIQSIADQSFITLCCTPLPIDLWAAPDAIIQALTNLLSNAIKFSSPGDTVWLKAELQSHSSVPPSHLFPACAPYLIFTVKDQGRGIPSDKLEIIFEQFQQVDISDSSQKGGTGLGLAICKSIVQQHGGQIWVESVFGEGSTFYIALPMNEKDIG